MAPSRDVLRVTSVLVAIVGLFMIGVHGRAVKIKTAYRPLPQSQNDKMVNGIQRKMADGFDVITEEEAVFAANQQTEICGKRPLHPPSQHWPRPSVARVVAGIASTNRWPWQVALLNKTSLQPICGGTLIGREHIITAAHCFDNEERNANDIVVVLGEHDRSRHEGTEQQFDIDCIHVHRRYVKGVPYNNDIALVKLKTSPGHDVIITDFVMPACLPEKNEFRAGDMCYVTGWGYTSFLDFTLGRRPNILNQALVPILSQKECRGAYGSFISNRMVCAGYLEGERRADTCKGDSGGPLVCQQVDGSWKLLGVTSWGENSFCNPSPTDAVPGVYTKVSKYRKWIEKIMKLTKCQTHGVPQSK